MSLLNISTLHQPIKLFYNNESSYSISIQSPNNLTSNLPFTLPNTTGSKNQILKANANNTLSWGDPGIFNNIIKDDLIIGEDNSNILTIHSILNIPYGNTGQVLTKRDNGFIELTNQLYTVYEYYNILGKSQIFLIQSGNTSISSQTKWQWDKDNSSNIKNSTPALIIWNSDTEFKFNKIGIYKITMEHRIYSDDSQETSDLKCIMSDTSNNAIISFSQHFESSSSGNDTGYIVHNTSYLNITNTSTLYRWSAGCATNSGVYHDQDSTFFTAELIYTNDPIIQIPGTGGIKTQYILNDVTYKVHTFLSSDIFLTDGSITVDYLLVAGGGGGAGPISGSNEGAGGGGGGLIYKTNITMNGTYHIVIGAGGNGGYQNAQTNGENSSISGLDTALGGGSGAGQRDDSGSNDNGANGGSGGGGRHYGGVGGNAIAFSGSPTENSTTANEVGVFGNDGGSNDPSGYSNYNNYGGGGGGAGARGYHNNETSSSNRGVGGIGKQYNIRDGTTNVYYAGGGGGGRHNPSAAGGLGGGGAGNDGYNNNAVSGTANTGGGGGGASQGSPYTNPAGNGGSGIVIIRYAI